MDFLYHTSRGTFVLEQLKTTIMKRKMKNYLIIRRNIFKHLIVFALLLSSISAIAQDQKALFKEWGSGEITPIKFFGDRGSEQLTTAKNNVKHTLELFNQDNKYMWGVKFKQHFNSGIKTTDFIVHPTQQAHPTYLMSSAMFDKNFKYYMKFGNKGTDGTKLIIIGDYMYELKYDLNDKWKLENLYVKGKLGMVKFMRLTLKLAKLDHNKIVSDYLAKEEKELAAKTPAFKENNAEYYTTLMKESGKADWDMKESQRIAWEARVGKAVRVYNGGSRIIWVGHKTGGGTQKIKPGETATFTCNVTDVYELGPNGDKSGATYLFKPRNMCGKKYTIR